MVKKMFKKAKGFTLTELIVVVTILGVLTAIAVPLLTSYIGDAETNADNSNAKTIEGVVKRSIAKRELVIGSSDSAKEMSLTNIKAKIVAELGSLPAIKQSGFKFCVNITTGVVEAKNVSSAPSGWVLLE
jgi:prepilin-type N-terminal cleavage/methylation domain-containing protein